MIKARPGMHMEMYGMLFIVVYAQLYVCFWFRVQSALCCGAPHRVKRVDTRGMQARAPLCADDGRIHVPC